MAEIPSYISRKKYKSRIEKRKDRWASRSTASFFRSTGEEVPVCDNSSSTAAAQQQRSSSTAAAQQQQKQQSRCSRGGGGGDGGEGGVGGGNTASLFWHSCRSITMVHQKERRGHEKNMVDTSSPRLMSKLILVVRTYRLASPVRGPAAAAAAVPLLASACVPKNTKRETICCDGLCSAMHRGS